jgi:ubiquinone/menaquinone biosynthesis C-methylase UbiE
MKEVRMKTIVSSNPAEDERLAAIKARQQTMWASGDYAVIGVTLQIVGELLAEAADIGAIDFVLDVAAGNGNATLAAARRFATVTSTDYVPELLDGGRRRADADGLTNVTFETADVEALPYGDATFDAVLSTFGVMFAPNHARAAAEMLRVCKPGGRIGLASWTPAGFVGQMFRVIGKHVPAPPGVQSPLLWGTESHLETLFPSVTRIDQRARAFAFRYRSAQHFVDVFRRFYGPTHKAFAALDETRQAALEHDLLDLLQSADTRRSSGLVVPSEYLETVIVR